MGSQVVLEAGDIVLTRSRSFVSRAIRFFTRSVGEAPSSVSHSALVVAGGPLLDAQIVGARARGVVLERLGDAHAGEWVAVYRPVAPYVRPFDIDMAVTLSLAALGRRYPFLRLLAHLVDWFLLDLYLARRALRFGNLHECSELVALAYRGALIFNGRPTWAVTPDDIHDEARRSPVFACVRPLAVLEVNND